MPQARLRRCGGETQCDEGLSNLGATPSSTADRTCNLFTGRPGLGCRPLYTASRPSGRPTRTDLTIPDPLRVRSSWRVGATRSSILQTPRKKCLLFTDAIQRIIRRSPSRMTGGGGSVLIGSWLCSWKRGQYLSDRIPGTLTVVFSQQVFYLFGSASYPSGALPVG